MTMMMMMMMLCKNVLVMVLVLVLMIVASAATTTAAAASAAAAYINEEKGVDDDNDRDDGHTLKTADSMTFITHIHDRRVDNLSRISNSSFVETVRKKDEWGRGGEESLQVMVCDSCSFLPVSCVPSSVLSRQEDVKGGWCLWATWW